MALQTKFSLLFAALAAAVLLALAAAYWALDVTYREVREPVGSASHVLGLLVRIEQATDELRALTDPASEGFRAGAPDAEGVPAGIAPAIDAPTFAASIALIDELLRQIEHEGWADFAGRSATRTLSAKIAALRLRGASYFHPPSPPSDTAEAGPVADASLRGINNQLFQVHELLKKMEERVVKDIQALAEASGDLRSRLSVVLGLALFIVALTGGLALSLIRRWVIRPVAGLRTAAARIAAGDFEHRVPIPTRAPADEMTALSTEVNHMASMVKRMQTERIEQERLAAIGELVRRLAHNLRNPLSGIRGLAELTRSDAAAFGPAADEARENQDRIIKAVDRFEGWLADLLRVTKPTRVEPAPTDVPRWLAGLVEAHRPSAQTRGITLELDTTAAPATAEFDARHLEHAVSALISNALEAATVSISGHHTARVRVSSHANHPTNGQCARSWEIRVEDTGPGIPPHIRESIFKPYFTTKKDGNGIGLASAQQVARAHGGEITVWGCREAAFDGKAFTLTGAALVIRLPLAGPTTGFDDRSG